MMQKDISFAELRGLLRSLGFSEVQSAQPGLGYRHAGSDTLLVFREYQPTEFVSSRDMSMTQYFLEQRGIMAREGFENYFRKAPA